MRLIVKYNSKKDEEFVRLLRSYDKQTYPNVIKKGIVELRFWAWLNIYRLDPFVLSGVSLSQYSFQVNIVTESIWF